MKKYENNIRFYNLKHNWSSLSRLLDVSRQHAKRLYSKFKNNYSKFIFHGNKNKRPWNKFSDEFVKKTLDRYVSVIMKIFDYNNSDQKYCFTHMQKYYFKDYKISRSSFYKLLKQDNNISRNAHFYTRRKIRKQIKDDYKNGKKISWNHIMKNEKRFGCWIF